MRFCGDASVWAKLALFLLVCGLAIHCAGIGTPDWEHLETIQELTDYSVGLWNYLDCSGGSNAACSSGVTPDSLKSGSFVCVQVFVCLILVMMVVVVFMMCFYVASARFRELPIAVAVVIICFTTVAFGVVCTIVWLTQIPSNYYPGYSFGLSTFAVLLYFLSAMLMLPDIRAYGAARKKHDVLKVNPYDEDMRATYRKYDDVGNTRFDDGRYSRNLKKFNEERDVRHYYNPHREPYVHQNNVRSPPPSYRTPSPTNYRKQERTARSVISTPDVYLGQLTPRNKRY